MLNKILFGCFFVSLLVLTNPALGKSIDWEEVDPAYKATFDKFKSALVIDRREEVLIKGHLKTLTQENNKKGVCVHPVWAVTRALLCSEDKKAIEFAYSIIDDGYRSQRNASQGVLARLGFNWGGSRAMNAEEEGICRISVEASPLARAAGCYTSGVEKYSDGTMLGLLPHSKSILKRLLASSLSSYDSTPSGYPVGRHYDVDVAKVSGLVQRVFVNQSQTHVESASNPLLKTYLQKLYGKSTTVTNPASISHDTKSAELGKNVIAGLKLLYPKNEAMKGYLDGKIYWYKKLWPVLSWGHIELIDDVLTEMRQFPGMTDDYILTNIVDPLLNLFNKIIEVDAHHLKHNVQKYLQEVSEKVIWFYSQIGTALGSNLAAKKWFKDNEKRIMSIVLERPILTYEGHEQAPNTAPIFVFEQLGSNLTMQIMACFKAIADSTDQSWRVEGIVQRYASQIEGLQQAVTAQLKKPQIAGGSQRLQLQ